MQTWSKQTAACSVSFCFKERSYYGLWQIDFSVNDHEVTHIQLTDFVRASLFDFFKQDGWLLTEEG